VDEQIGERAEELAGAELDNRCGQFGGHGGLTRI
jgi:hypothetical protein